MEIKFIANDVVETDCLHFFLTAQGQASWSDNQGSQHDCQVNWTGPAGAAGFGKVPQNGPRCSTSLHFPLA